MTTPHPDLTTTQGSHPMTTTDAPPAIAILTNRYLHASFLRHAVLKTAIVAGLVLAFFFMVDNDADSYFFSVPVFVLLTALSSFFTTLFDHPGIFSANAWAGLSRSETVWAWTGWLVAHALLVCAIAGGFYLLTPDAVLAAENSTTVSVNEQGTVTTVEETRTFSSLDGVLLSIPITLSALASGLAVVVSFMVFSRLVAFLLLVVTSPFVYWFAPMPVEVEWQVPVTLAVAVVHFVFAMLFVCTSTWRR